MSIVNFVFDGDGTLVRSGELLVSVGVRNLLDGAPVRRFLATGRGVEYCEVILQQINGHGLFAENGGAFRFADEEVQLVTNGGGVLALKRVVNFTEIRDNVASLVLGRETIQMPFEPKRSILTLRPLDLGFNLDPQEVRRKMEAVIALNNLKVEVAGPHGDGGTDFQDEGINKGLVPKRLKQRFPDSPIVVFVDGPNDISMASSSEVDLVVTFKNGHPDLKRIVRERNGIIVETPGPEGGCEEGIQRALEVLERRRKNGSD